MKMSNTEAGTHRYSLLAMVLMIGVPLLMYLFAATQSVDMREALKPGVAPNVLDVAMGGGLFVMRIGAIVFGVLGTLLALFGAPKETAPKWMRRR